MPLYRLSLRKSLLMSVPASVITVASAHAACTPAVPASGQTVTCTDTQTGGYVVPNAVPPITGVTINIQPGATVSGTRNSSETGTAANQQNFSVVGIRGASTVNNAGTITNVGTALQNRDNAGVTLNGIGASLLNSGSINIVSPVGTPTTLRTYGVLSTQASGGAEYEGVSVVNSGTIAIAAAGAGRAIGVYAGEDIGSMQITNSGLIQATRAATATGTQAVAAIDSDDDVDDYTVINQAGGRIVGVGTGARAIRGQAQDMTIVNNGEITAPAGGLAVVIFGAGEVELENAGTINGGIRFAEAEAAVGGANLVRRNSEIENTGVINGSITLGRGDHVLMNDGTINGGITFLDTAQVTIPGMGVRPQSMNTLVLGTNSVITGNIAASGLGINSLILTSRATGGDDDGGAGGGDDDDDDDAPAATGAGTLRSNVTGFTTLTQTDGIFTLAAGTTQTFSQGATIQGGTLFVDSTLNAPTVSVEAAGTLGGIGTINGNLFNAGVVTPGSAADLYGTLTLNGAYNQNGDARFAVNGTASGMNSRLLINGGATLAGDVLFQGASGTYVPQTRYTVLTATGGLTGQFETVSSTGLPTLLAPEASYEGNDVVLTLEQQSFALVARTQNQRNAAVGLDAALAGNTAALTYLDNQSDRTLSGILDRVAGQGYASVADPQFRAGRAFTDTLMTRAYTGAFEDGATGFMLPPATYAADLPKRGPVPEPRFVQASRGYGIWAAGYGQVGTVTGNANAAGRDERIAGAVAGIDMHPTAGSVLGVAAGYGSVDVTLKSTGERAHTDNAQVAVYGGVSSGPVYALATAGYARADGRLNRSLAGLQLLQPGGARGTISGDQFLSAGEVGYRYAYAPKQAIVPFVGFQVSTFSQDRLGEVGSGPFDLSVAAKDFLSARTQVGGRLEHIADFGGSAVSFAIKAAYVHDFADVGRTIQSSFVLAPAVPFTVEGRRLGRERALIGAGITAAIAPNWTGFVTYDGEVAQTDTIHSGRGGVRYSF